MHRLTDDYFLVVFWSNVIHNSMLLLEKPSRDLAVLLKPSSQLKKRQNMGSLFY